MYTPGLTRPLNSARLEKAFIRNNASLWCVKDDPRATKSAIRMKIGVFNKTYGTTTETVVKADFTPNLNISRFLASPATIVAAILWICVRALKNKIVFKMTMLVMARRPVEAKNACVNGRKSKG
ncbi:hypothetical protein PoB_004048100 [Plakobranchus ocellatus]|uniref:Uncharacterized protein n=1 Tax=Plakobranchus ocellatus TaxID=259542 RepID=A0AAV4AS79_9GAST|nr:hypothetical protein PoB_004048100 [Plakobranchus ocellatus]